MGKDQEQSHRAHGVTLRQRAADAAKLRGQETPEHEVPLLRLPDMAQKADQFSRPLVQLEVLKGQDRVREVKALLEAQSQGSSASVEPGKDACKGGGNTPTLQGAMTGIRSDRGEPVTPMSCARTGSEGPGAASLGK